MCEERSVVLVAHSDLWQGAAPAGADAVGESDSTGEGGLFALGFSPSAVSASVRILILQQEHGEQA